MSSTITFRSELITEDCCNCGMLFAMTNDFRQRRLDDRETFYCPSGHGQSYTGKTEAQRLKDQLAQQKRKTEYMEAQRDKARGEKRTVKRQLSAQKGIVTKMKKRSVHGVCPCCSRTFKQLQRHIANKHPEFVKENK